MSAAEEDEAQKEVGALTLMDQVIEKLKIINYEFDFCKPNGIKPMSRTYFALALKKPGEQFSNFSLLCHWLFQLLGVDFQKPHEMDAPLETCGRIYNQLRELRLPTDFSHKKLRLGCGFEVCMVLNVLLDLVFQQHNVEMDMPQYPVARDEPDMEEILDEEDDLDGFIADEVAVNSSDEEEMYFGGVVASGSGSLRGSSAGKGKQDGKQKGEDRRILESQVSAEEWKIELERVAPRLTLRVALDAKDWRSHIDQIKSLRNTISETLPGVERQLSKLSTDISKQLDKIRRREQSMSSQFSDLVEQYRQVQDRVNVVEVDYRASRDAINALTNTLNEISDELEDVKIQMDERGNKMRDTSPVVQIKQCITQIKDEIKDMEMQIGILQNALVQEEVKARHRVKSAGRRSRGDTRTQRRSRRRR